MKRLQSNAVLLSLIDNLQAKGSWCGETHVQKATYFIQELFGVPLGFDFILYKHGPFSFDLNDELTAMQADQLLKVQSKPRPYGPSLVPTEGGERIKKHFAKTLNKYDQTVQFVTDHFGKRGVAELERLATALYVTQRDNVDGNVESRAKRINELKPHVKIEEAHEAVLMVDEIIEDARGVQMT
jgi:hypothetical protein